MKKFLLTTALTLGLAALAHAGNITVTNYTTPDGQGSGDITTTAVGAPDTPYSYYTGPVVFTLSDNSNLTVYCVDLNHFLETSATYMLTPLTTNGEGQSISEFNSNRIGHIAAIGAAALKAGGINNLDLAAAAQAAIWDISYQSDSVTSVSNDGPTGPIAQDIITFLNDAFPNVGYATALQPFGQYWPTNTGASQEMVVGFASGVPEPGTWAMLGIGFGLMAAVGWRKKSARYAIARL